MAERCTGKWEEEAALNFAVRLITSTLPERLGRPWNDLDFQAEGDIAEQARGRVKLNPKGVEALRKTAAMVLEQQLAIPKLLHPEIVATAARAAAEGGFTELEPKLAQVEKALPAATIAESRIAELRQKIAQKEKELGKEASYAAYSRRKYPSSGSDIPGLDVPPSLDPEPAEKAGSAPKPPAEILHVDAMRDEESGWQETQTWREKEIAGLRRDLAEARRRLAARDDAAALKAWALEPEKPGGLWAYRRLREVNRAGAIKVLEVLLQHDRTNPAEAAAIALELAEADPKRARELAASLPEKLRGCFPPALLATTDESEKSVATLLRMAEDPQKGNEGRAEAIGALVPAANPRKFSGEEIDQVLLRLLKTEFPDDNIQWTKRAAANALARRNAARHWDALEEAVSTLDTFGHADLLNAMALAVEQDRAKFAPHLQAFVEPKLKETNFSIEGLVGIAWAADLRELKPAIEAIATSGPEDYGANDRTGGKVGPIKYRHHLARIVASIWNEEDAPTRAKLIAAFGVEQPQQRDTARFPGSARRGELAFAAACRGLSEAEQAQVSDFLTWLEKRSEQAGPWLITLRERRKGDAK
jgi:hypothetical protein